MPALKNHRHEAFAQALVRATRTKMTNGQCYSASGYSATGEAAEAAASRLLCDGRQDVGKRVNEIMEASATRVEVTTASLLGDLNRIMAGAETAEQFAAAKAAVDSKARLKGLFVDKLEIGAPGEFAACETPESVVDALCAMASPGEAADALNALAGLLEARAGRAARDVSPAPRRIGSTFERKWPGRRRAP